MKERRLPFKAALQDMYPKRSIDLNDYLWGFIYTPIANHTGHSPIEVHEECKRTYNHRFDFQYNPDTKREEIVFGVGSTTTMDMKDMWDYAARIRADAELDLHITLLLPNEAWIDELNFEYENSNELRRI